MKSIENLFASFPITEEEYKKLDDKFGKLCHFAAWQLDKKNSKISKTDEQEDFVQELKMALIRAGSYYKRQTYIEDCFIALEPYMQDKFIKGVFEELKNLWNNRTRHGANRQKFGKFQEDILERLVKNNVPEDESPKKDRPLKLDKKFVTYCKAITWNAQKSMGRKITREKSWRSGLASLSEYDYLAKEGYEV